MPYTINMPNAADQINDTQPLIRDNFNEIQTDFARNHVPLLDPTIANRGKHNLVTWPRSGAGLALIADEIKVYNDLSALTGISELFVQKFGGAAIPFTSSGYDAGSQQGWFYLPCRHLVKYGVANVPGGNGNIVYHADANTPVFISVRIVLTTVNSLVGNTYISKVSAFNNVLQFTAQTFNTAGAYVATGINFIAIGY